MPCVPSGRLGQLPLGRQPSYLKQSSAFGFGFGIYARNVMLVGGCHEGTPARMRGRALAQEQGSDSALGKWSLLSMSALIA